MEGDNKSYHWRIVSWSRQWKQMPTLLASEKQLAETPSQLFVVFTAQHQHQPVLYGQAYALPVSSWLSIDISYSEYRLGKNTCPPLHRQKVLRIQADSKVRVEAAGLIG